MAKGYNANQERLAAIGAFGKALAKRAGFACEWCGSKDDLRAWDYRPNAEPDASGLALLCLRCRDLADGMKAEENELHSIRNALWSDVPAVAEGAARVLAQCKEGWVREAIEESFIDDAVKQEIFSRR
jgi:protein PhnA